METLFVFAFLFLAALVILPIVILVRISAIERKMSDIEKSIFRLYKKEATQEKAAKEKPVPVIEEQIIVEPKPVVIVEPETLETPETEEYKPVIQQMPEIPEMVEMVEIVEQKEEPVQEPEIPVVAAAFVKEEKKEKEVHKQPRTNKAPTFTFENLLSKIGIVTLVLGIAFFVKYAIDKDWIDEIGRVGIGIFTGGIIIAIAHKLRKKYNLFSAILVGGGISILYITITLAFREYELFNQTTAFIILIVITLFSVLLSLLYDRKELALFSLLGGYASPLMISTGEGNYIVLFTFLLILNSGMLLISMRKKWNIIGIVSFICTQAFYWVWLILSFEDQYTGALIFGVLFFIQFYLLALFDHFLSEKNISPFQAFLILANNLSLFAACIIIFRNTGYKVEGLITISMSVINAIVMLWLFKRAHVDKKLIYLIIAIVLSFVSLAIPVQLNGHVITMFWAAEMVILLWLWLKSGIQVFRKGFLLIGLLTLGSYFMDVNNNYMGASELPILFNRMFITGLVFVASLVVCKILLNKMNTPEDNAPSLLSRLLNLAVIAIAYLVPFFEIYYQIANSNYSSIDGFITMVLSAYTFIYIAALIFIYRKSTATYPQIIYALFVFMIVYSIVAIPSTIQARNTIFEIWNSSLFLIHYLALPGLIYIVYSLVKNLRIVPQGAFTFCSWVLVIISVTILSVELDSTIAQIGATPQNYEDLVYDVRTFGYPILWGLLAMFLMIWGLRAKEVLLRKISLAFFAFIILKFYISDIWLMSQTGRIISFVALGVILLLVSFLIQKIKNLIKDDHETDKE